MDTNPLFSAALGLASPWKVVRTAFDVEAKRLDLFLDFTAGSRFTCPECSKGGCAVHDTVEKEWRHLDFFQHLAFIHARVPRVLCGECGVRLATVPWARPGSGFTLLAEALILELARNMPVKPLAKMLGVDDKTIWRVLEHYVDAAVERMDTAQVRRIGMDETSVRKHHDYLTLFFDFDRRRLLFMAEGKGHETVADFVAFLTAHGGAAKRVQEVSCDLSAAFQKGIREELPEASVTFDRFHVAKLLSEALDTVRRTEWRKDQTIKGTRYLVLKSPDHLNTEQKALLEQALARNANLAEAYRLKETFRDLYAQPSWEAGRGFLKAWLTMALQSGIKPMVKVAKTIRAYWSGILHWFVTRMTNGIMEGLNSLIQAAKRKARGYRNHKTFRLIAYLIAGKLDLRAPALRTA